MTCRIYPDPQRCNPRPLWAALDALGLQTPRMIGWWDTASPVSIRGDERTEDVRATLYVGESTFAIALASWSTEAVEFKLHLDRAKLTSLGLSIPNGASLQLSAPAIAGFQPGGSWLEGEILKLFGKGSGRKEGMLLRLAVG